MHRRSPTPVDTTLLLKGTSFPLKSMIRFIKNERRNRISVQPPNGILVKFLLSMLPPLLEPCNKLKLPMKTLLTILKTLCLSIPMPATHSEARPTPRRSGSNDSRLAPIDNWVPFTLLTAKLLHFLPCLPLPCHRYMSTPFILVVNLILMPTLVLSV